MSLSPKEIHDELLKNKPESAEHISDECAFCNDNINKQTNTTEGGDMKTYTEEEFTTAVKEAVAPLQAAAEAKVAELQAELDKINASKASEEVAGQIAEIKIELDNTELARAKAVEDYNNLVAFLEAEKVAAEELATREARKDAIRAAVKEAAGFDDERIEANIDRWVDMSEEDFATVVEDWKLIKSTETKVDETASKELTNVPAETAMSTVRNENKATPNVARTVFSARSAGVDVRKF